MEVNVPDMIEDWMICFIDDCENSISGPSSIFCRFHNRTENRTKCAVKSCNTSVGKTCHSSWSRWCHVHRHRNAKFGSPTPIVNCFGCKIDFIWIGAGFRSRRYCDDCLDLIGQLEGYLGKLSISFLQNVRKHGLTLARFMEILVLQDFSCAICKCLKRGERRLSIDHDHICCPGPYSCGGCVRGLLCNPCNMVVGLCDETTNFIKNLEDYVNEIRVTA